MEGIGIMEILWLLLPMGLVALLYASVGHGGASGYLAVMALAGLAPELLKPTALSLNLLVSGLALLAFGRAGYFRGRLFWPFAAFSIPTAFLGGRWVLDSAWFYGVLGVVLAISAVRLCLPLREPVDETAPPIWAVALAGSIMGFVSGLIGVGGGIFLTPFLLLFGWARAKTASAVSAPFIFVNSAAGLAGHALGGQAVPSLWLSLAPAVLIGGFIGSRWGSRVAQPKHIRWALAAVLAVATAKIAL